MITTEIQEFKLILKGLKLLAIDYGMKKIGLANTDKMGIMAFALGIVENNSLGFEKIINLLKDYNGIVIGWPLDAEGKEQNLCESIIKFAQRIKKENNLPILLVDERFTTRFSHVQDLYTSTFAKAALKNSKSYSSNKITSTKTKNSARYNLEEDWYKPNAKYNSKKKVHLQGTNFKDDSLAASNILNTAISILSNYKD